MSMFLGPIHQWLYNKIQNGAERASAIEDAFKCAFGAEADALIAEMDDSYPAFPVGIPLEDIIGDAQIHPFLMGLIRMVETREGALIAAFTKKYADKAADIALATAEEFGKKTGDAAKGEVNAGDMQSLYKALYDHQLDGMPCDQGAQPELSGDKLVITQSECLHSNNWKEAGAPLELMCKITGAWMKGFLAGSTSGMKYNIEDSVIEGSGACKYCISPA